MCAPRQHVQMVRFTGDLRTGGRTTRSPVHGCLPPPSKGGSKGLGRGIASTQHTHSAWNRNLRLQGPSCSAAGSCTLASVGLLHPGMIKGCSKSVAAPKDEELVQRQEYLDTTNAEKYSEYF